MGVPVSHQFVQMQNNMAAKSEGAQDHFEDWGTHMLCDPIPQLDASKDSLESAQSLVMLMLNYVAVMVPGRQAHRHDNTSNRNSAYKNTA